MSKPKSLAFTGSWMSLLVVFDVFLSTQTAAQERIAYICAEQGATGFSPEKDNNSYKPSMFFEQRFTMILEGSTLEVKVKNTTEKYTCDAPWVSSPHLLQCVEMFYFMGFNANTLSFTRAQIFGNLRNISERDTLSVSYGECQRF